MAEVLNEQVETKKVSRTQTTDVLANFKSNHHSNSWLSSCYGLKVKHPSDVIQIFHADDGLEHTSIPVTRFWTGSSADENLLAQGEYVLLEIQHTSNLIFMNNKFQKPAENAENPKLLIPINTAESIGFSRLANVGPVVQKTPTCTFIMQKVKSDEECEGSTALYLNNQIFKIDSKVHECDANEGVVSFIRSNLSCASLSRFFKQSFRDLFSIKVLFVMLLARYGLGLANEKYGFLEKDSMKLWMKDAYMSMGDFFFNELGTGTDKSPKWYEVLWLRFFS